MSAAGPPAAAAVRRTWRAYTGLLVLLGLVVIARSTDPDAFHHDIGWILYSAGEMQSGATLYRDLIDENPPLVFWLSVPPVALARALGLPPILVFNAAVFLAIAFILELCRRLQSGVGWVIGSGVEEGEGSNAARRLEGDRFALVLCSALALVLVLQAGADFGQREHLFVILVLPYLFAAARFLDGRPLGPGLGLAVGAIAGMGIALKPYFAALPIAVELSLLLLRRRGESWRRAEPWAIAGIHIAYAASVLLFAPGYLDVVALAWPVYNAYNVAPEFLNVATVSVATAALAMSALRSTRFNRSLRPVWLAACGAGLAIGYFQRKGWDYHFLPAVVFAAALLGSVVLGSLAKVRMDRGGWGRRAFVFAPGLFGLVAAVALAWTLHQSFGPGRERPTLTRALTALVADRAAGQPILVLSSSVNPSFPVVNLSGARWAQRFCCMWVLPAVYSRAEKAVKPFPYHAYGEMGALERFAHDALVADMAAAKPVLVIVDKGRSKFGFGRTAFDYLEYFHRDPHFARMFREYRFLADVGVFRVFQREPRPGDEPPA